MFSQYRADPRISLEGFLLLLLLLLVVVVVVVVFFFCLFVFCFVLFWFGFAFIFLEEIMKISYSLFLRGFVEFTGKFSGQLLLRRLLHIAYRNITSIKCCRESY
jgi:energy-coupling factor transporter transmembrane protein EcfT